MKLTRDRLKQIIKEELEEMMVDEAVPPPPPPKAPVDLPKQMTAEQVSTFLLSLKSLSKVKPNFEKYLRTGEFLKNKEEEYKKSKIWIPMYKGSEFLIIFKANDGKPLSMQSPMLGTHFVMQKNDPTLGTVLSYLQRAVGDKTPTPPSKTPPPPPPGQAPKPPSLTKNQQRVVPPPPPPKPKQ